MTEEMRTEWFDWIPSGFQDTIRDFDSLQRLLSSTGATGTEFGRVMERLGMPSDMAYRYIDKWIAHANYSEVVDITKTPNDAGGYYTETATQYTIRWGVWDIIVEETIYDAPWQIGGNSGQLHDNFNFYLRLKKERGQ